MSTHKFNTFEEMKNSHINNDEIITDKEKRDIIKELSEMREVLSKNVRKPTEKEKIK